MGHNKNETNLLARNIAALIRRVVVLLGRPLFLILFLSLALIFQIINLPLIIGRGLTGIFSGFRSGRKTRGEVFSNKLLKSKLFLKKTQKKVYSVFKRYKDFIWKIQVFILAAQKLRGKIYPKAKTKKPKLSFYKVAGALMLFVFTVSFILGLVFWQVVLRDLPSSRELAEKRLQVSTKIYDRNHILLYTIYKDQKRTPVSLDQMPAQVRWATIAAEDIQFYSHPGFSVRGIVRAILTDIREHKLTGGSTITQQLVKNTLLTPEKTVIRKLKEIILAIEVERTYDKDKILEMYLNTVAYGGTAYGIQEAARTYFDKDVDSLTLGEAALLAGLPQSPTKYSPFGQNPEIAIEREKDVLRRMEEAGFISSQQRSHAENENITFAQNKTSIKAPHFVFFVRDGLEEKYGKEVVQEGGLDVVTTLDFRIQSLIEEVVKEELDKLKNLNVGNAAVVVINPANGEILGMVGSKDFFDSEHGGNVNVATRPRQPGSSIKVINYAYALSNGLTPATIIPDTPTTFTVEGQPPYTPKNYEGDFRGNLTLRSAFAESRNIPAVKVLASYGVDKMVDMGQKMGITTWDNPNNYGLSLTLGGGEVKLLDLAHAYSVVADYGKKPNLVSILKVTNFEGKVLEEAVCKETDNPIAIVKEVSATGSSTLAALDKKAGCGGEQVLDPRVAFMITDILKDNDARSPSFGTNSLLVIKGHPEVAVKTGTSNDLRDNLAVGYTKDFLVSVWIGNNDNSPMSRIASGVTGATPIFNKIMTALLSDKSSYDWPIPNDLDKLPVCPYTGTLACEGCPVKMEWFLNENKPEKACSSDWFKNEGSQNLSITPTPAMTKYFENIFQEQMKKIKRKINPGN